MTLAQNTCGSCRKIHNLINLLLWLLVTLSLVKQTNAWGSEELELFDVVEEVNQNFYQLLSISEDADTKEIKKAFRRLSLVLHPDKNDAPDADVKFRQLVSVYEILSDEQKRKTYNEVLVNGLPDWKHAVYYYRRVRKMGLLEMAVILFLLVTIGQYAVLWAAYAEKKYTAEQIFSSKIKKMQKKQKKGKTDGADEDMQIDIPKPSVFDLLPFRSLRFTWLVITGVPHLYRFIRDVLEERRRQRELEAEESSEESAQDEDDEERKERRARRRKAFLPPELGPEESCLLDPADGPDSETSVPVAPHKVITGGLWTDDDLTELVRLIKKFPGGTPQRWEKIAEAMNRSVPEVTHMAVKVKEENYKPAPLGAGDEMPPLELKPSKVKTKGGRVMKGEGNTEEGETPANQEQVQDVWSQPQQKALESALVKFPKGTSERWVKIAKCVQEKSMEECILRYKYLVEVVKKKKEQQQESNCIPNPESPEPSSV